MAEGPLSIALIDPSLFSLSYDYELGDHLARLGHKVCLYVRPLRKGEDRPLPNSIYIQTAFYRQTDWLSERFPASRLAKLFKAFSHVLSLLKLAKQFSKERPDILHMQWTPFPLADRLFCRWIARATPVVFTAHNTVPSHGVQRSSFQTKGYWGVLQAANKVIVHWDGTRQALVANGLTASAIEVVGFPPIPIRASKTIILTERKRPRVLLFGALKPYKGIDLLVAASIELIQAGLDFDVHITGKPFFDLAPIYKSIMTAGLQSHFYIEERFLSESEIFEAIANSDIVVFPYREIDGSGAFASMQGLNKAIILTNVGIFSKLELPNEVAANYRVQPDNLAALRTALGRLLGSEEQLQLNSRAMAQAIERLGSWEIAAEEHLRIYREVLERSTEGG